MVQPAILIRHLFQINEALKFRLKWLNQSYRLEVLLFVLTKEFEIAKPDD